jgi:hypothetical protein
VDKVGCEIAAADAACDGTGVLFDRHTVVEPDGNGEGRTVEFFFGRLDVIASICMWRTRWRQRRLWRLRWLVHRKGFGIGHLNKYE